MSRVVATFTAEGFTTTFYEDDNGLVHGMADLDVDVDGSGNSHGDPCFQPDTTLHFHGKPLNSDVDKFIVVSPLIIKGVKRVVLGCQARVHYKGRSTFAVVGDVGPTKKIGEASRAVAIALGINPSPVSGGVDEPEVLYELQPGVPAVVDDRHYELKAFHG